MHANRLDDLREKLTTHFRPVQRSFQFWVRVADIYTGYKFRVNFVKDAKKQELMWERQHEIAAEKIYSMCSELGGFFLKKNCSHHFVGCSSRLSNHARGDFWSITSHCHCRQLGRKL